MPTQIVAKDLTWCTPEGRAVIDHVSLSLGTERVGLVGNNGTGKTTLLRLLSRELKPTEGTCDLNTSVGYLPQIVGAASDETVAEAVGVAAKMRALELIRAGTADQAAFDIVGDDWDIEGRAESVFHSLGMTSDWLKRIVLSLSGGEMTRVMLARVILRRTKFLLLDEPTNNLDWRSREFLYQMLRNWTSGCIVASHDRALLELMDRTLELSDGRVASYGGGFSEYRELRDREDQAVTRRVAIAERELKKEQQAARLSRERQVKRASAGRKNRNTSGQAKIILGVWKESSERTSGRSAVIHDNRVAKAEQSLAEARDRIRPQNQLRLELPKLDLPNGKVVIELEDVAFSYAPDSSSFSLNHLTFQVVGPERIAITGSNGSGKSTVLKLIAGLLEPVSGEIRHGVHRIGYLEQNTFGLHEDETALDNFERISGVHSDGLARQYMSRLLFFRNDVYKTAASLSGGERVRLALGAILYSTDPPQLLLIDEPTNHLDLNSIEQLESSLLQYEGAIIVVSHDPAFLETIQIETEIALGMPN